METFDFSARRKELVDSGGHEALRQRSFLAEIGKQWKILPDDQKKVGFGFSLKTISTFQTVVFVRKY